MGAAALQKYIGSLGGIGASGVGSSSSYSPKELNKDIMPEKNVKTFKDVKGCDDAKKELEEVVEYLKNPSKFTRLGGKLPKVISICKLHSLCSISCSAESSRYISVCSILLLIEISKDVNLDV
jgi:hypothetical protein